MIDGGKELLEQLDKIGIHVDAALWYFFTDVEKWKLLISMPKLKNRGPKTGYLTVQKALDKLKSPKLSLGQIAVTQPNPSLLRLLKLAVRTGPGISGIRFTNDVVNGHLIEDAYVYRLL